VGRKRRKPENPTPNAKGGKNKDDEASDLNFSFDFGFRNNRSFKNPFETSDDDEVDPLGTRGSKTISINPAVDYDISKKLNARLFFDYTRNEPNTTIGFPTTNIAGGVRIRFTLD